ncbi:cardiolipin synthase ClsB [Ramlibacter sp. AW1]|uniref:Cardiolipin synthase B n=1 Tax=Ramlibacter aurantiacus TaxID=2801330 RepID=A0A936ZUA9_9BURK|nr:cardiolipin synthase ClsB [Ramlibacter aurantiacus]MBL0421290.1 cardiolipin synthase ClsB [Ramlibacter aurantiacus]
MNDWLPGNRFDLLENGEAFYPRVFEAMGQARSEIVVETFILFEDKVGLQLQAALVAAARRGVQVDLTIDGWGSPDLSDEFLGALTTAGVRVHIFDPGPRSQRLRFVKLLRRMHRKIIVIDGRLAFVGGINFSADHLADYGPQAKQDYAVEVHGPIVETIHRFVHAQLARGMRQQRRHRWWRWRRQLRAQPPELPHAGPAYARFVVRDNVEHRDDIERHYRHAIRSARERVVIANAYFFPGYRLVRELRQAARRGVEVRLILQGQPDMAIVKTAASTLYHHLLKTGVRVFEYCDRPLHGKVALVDREWATVGSSNLDPLSLGLNLEANVLIRDRAFNAELMSRLDRLVRDSCREVERDSLPPVRGLDLVRSYIAFHVMRKFPQWLSRLPRHDPHLASRAAVDLDAALQPPVAAKDPS